MDDSIRIPELCLKPRKVTVFLITQRGQEREAFSPQTEGEKIP